MGGPQLTTANKNNNSFTKIYYPNPTNYRHHTKTTSQRKNNEIEQVFQQQQQYQQQQPQQPQEQQQQQQHQQQQQQQQENGIVRKKGFNSGNILQYYYNNINNNDFTANNVNTNVNNNAEYLAKQSNININNLFEVVDGQEKDTPEKNPFSSTVRPLAMKISSPRPVSNFFSKTFRSDSQKRPLLLNYKHRHENGGGELCAPNFKIIPDKTGLKISPIYSISENMERHTPRKIKQQSNYFQKGQNANGVASCSRPLFVKK